MQRLKLPGIARLKHLLAATVGPWNRGTSQLAVTFDR
jgi:hypothetical protein